MEQNTSHKYTLKKNVHPFQALSSSTHSTRAQKKMTERRTAIEKGNSGGSDEMN